MYSLPTLLSLSLLASNTLAVTISSHPAKAARWIGIPRTLRDPEYLKRDNLGAREAPAAAGGVAADADGWTLYKKDHLLPRQSGCSATEVACLGNKCCPLGFNCYYSSGEAACCRVGQTCSGPPVGCADPGSLECPASVGGCCPIGQACYRDSAGVARCDSAGIYSSSSSYIPPTVSVPSYTSPTYTPPPYTPSPVPSPLVPTTTNTRVFTTAPQGQDPTKDGGIAQQTTVLINAVGKTMGMGIGALVVLMVDFVVLA